MSETSEILHMNAKAKHNSMKCHCVTWRAVINNKNTVGKLVRIKRSLTKHRSNTFGQPLYEVKKNGFIVLLENGQW